MTRKQCVAFELLDQYTLLATKGYGQEEASDNKRGTVMRGANGESPTRNGCPSRAPAATAPQQAIPLYFYVPQLTWLDFLHLTAQHPEQSCRYYSPHTHVVNESSHGPGSNNLHVRQQMVVLKMTLN
jgi:hypothetical protein